MSPTLHSHRPRTRPRDQGVVLPIALIMLVILSFAGLMAARKSSTYEQISNNLRTNQVARQAAEIGLRYCERAVINKVDNDDTTIDTKIFSTALADDKPTTLSAGAWNTKDNWKTSSPNLIAISTTTNAPTCVIQAMASDRYLITSRGLSGDADVDTTTGELKSGSEVWLQSILTPQASTVAEAASGGGVD